MFLQAGFMESHTTVVVCGESICAVLTNHAKIDKFRLSRSFYTHTNLILNAPAVLGVALNGFHKRTVPTMSISPAHDRPTSVSDIESAVQAMYASTPNGTRAEFDGDEERAAAFYKDYVDFVSQFAPIPASGASRLLDVGCGCGWSTYAFAKLGYASTGIDLNAGAFEPPAVEGLQLQEGSAMDIQFPDASFDVVGTYQCIEHVPEPETALREMIRVCKPGGMIYIVGPNLISPFLPLKHFVKVATRKEKLELTRTATTPHHPYGNTIGENLLSMPVNLGRLIKKVTSHKPAFSMRKPDTVPPFHADNDACYLCNPTDFLKFFPKYDCHIVQVGKPGRPPLSYLFAGGTWVAARKL